MDRTVLVQAIPTSKTRDSHKTLLLPRAVDLGAVGLFPSLRLRGVAFCFHLFLLAGTCLAFRDGSRFIIHKPHQVDSSRR